jgi:hypothetical protein
MESKYFFLARAVGAGDVYSGHVTFTVVARYSSTAGCLLLNLPKIILPSRGSLAKAELRGRGNAGNLTVEAIFSFRWP